jgi:L-threonylcarbamoyladenylate synthase
LGRAKLAGCSTDKPDLTQVATDLIEIDQELPSEVAIERAAVAIRRGQVVAIPSDSLYTLVADPFNLQAVGRVFAAKGRDAGRALPMLVADIMMAEDLVKEIPARFQLLARKFWPGPLTIIVPASAKVPLKVTGNTGRLGLRQSRSRTAQAIIDWLGQPLVSTSANVSGSPTCRSGIEVFGTMDGRIDLVLDGGCCVGSGATTVDVTEPYWKMIREGSITEREIAAWLKGS